MRSMGARAPALAVLCLLSLTELAGCGSAATNTPTATADPRAPRVGRTVCPGSVPWVATNLRGAPADALEQLQGTYEQDPGFLAVVFDGVRPIVVVERRALAAWQLRLAPRGVAVAPSCIDPGVLAAVHAVLPAVASPDRTVSAGYNGLDDAIDVLGIDADTLVAALETLQPGGGDAARDAIADGTLRIDPREVPGTR